MKNKIYNSPILYALIIILLPGTSLAQTIQWQETNIVEGNPIVYLQSNSSGDIFASRIGDFIGTIYRTTDMGETWTLQINGLAQGWRHLLAINSNNVIFAAGDIEISYSTDNSENWLPTAPILACPVALGIDYNDDIYFSGNIIEGGDIYKSTDDGNSWILINNGLENYWVNDIAFSADGYVFVAAFETQPPGFGKVFYSTNHGENWIQCSMDFAPDPEYIVVNTNGYIFVASYAHNIFRSTDIGNTWQLMNNNLNDITAIKTNQIGHIFVSSFYHGIYRSTDNGVSWESINSGLTHLYTGAIATDPAGFIYTGLGGLPGMIYRTTATSIPVELISFTADVIGTQVALNWQTATEINNSGFEVQRKESGVRSQESEWERVGYVAGFGTTTEPKSYSFADSNVPSGRYSYRLKQIDYDGNFEYSNIIAVEVSLFTELSLSQNYPNPFNPTTTIKYTISSNVILSGAKNLFVSLKVYDPLGNEVATLVNEEKPSGNYEVKFDGSSLSSGIYIYRMQAGSFTNAKKFILLR
jgi:photosystem II stability/assembly factor-like uncharacterized protein